MTISAENNLKQFLKLRSGSRDKALAFLMEHYGDALYGVASKIVGQQTLADDALQEGFIKIWKNIHDFNPEKASLYTWMFTIVRNTAIDLLRRESKRKIQSIDQSVSDNMANSVEAKITDVGLEQKIKQLNPKYHEIIEMIYLKGYTQQEVSDILKLPLGTVKTRVNTALKILRNILAFLIILMLTLIK
jgi:RNA polymerase sigma factor (sigma-70 family)